MHPTALRVLTVAALAVLLLQNLFGWWFLTEADTVLEVGLALAAIFSSVCWIAAFDE